MNNNFNIMRLLAAWMVLASHSFPLTGQPEPIGQLTGFLTGGPLAVYIFFFISGYVVTQSAQRRGLLTFCAARALRILPGLALVTVAAILLGAALTTLDQTEYWHSHLTWAYVQNVKLFPIYFRLPGVFEGLPFPSVNGSLWTLPLEASMYMCSAIFIVTRIQNSFVFAGLAVACLVGHFLAAWGFLPDDDFRNLSLLPGVDLLKLLPNAYFYLIGAAIGTGEWLRPKRLVGVFSLIAVLTIPLFGGYAAPVFFLTLPFAIHFLAFGFPIRSPFNVDISYGVYLYAFPVQQTILEFMGAQIGPTTLTALATGPTFLMGVISWKLIEKPALEIKKRLEAVTTSSHGARNAPR